jgi:Flp pilus assembly protein TadG
MNTTRQRAGRNRLIAGREGAAAVEFALTAPILFLFLFAAIEFGRYNMIRQTANDAAFEAARSCIVPGATAANGQSAGLSVLNVVGLKGCTVSINPTTITSSTTTVTATVTVPITSNLWTASVFCKTSSITTNCTLTCDWVDSAAVNQ